MMNDKKEILSIKNLKTHFLIDKKWVKAVDDVSFSINEGEILGLVGESGSGKSVTSLSILRLIPEPPGKIKNGEIIFQDRDILKLELPEMYKIRGNKISMIFQEPMTSLNPVFTIGQQLIEPIMLHKNATKNDAVDLSVKMLELVGIPQAKSRMNDYPHQFSGGMRQRVMIAMALVCNPSLLIADEPTTALDVTIQAQILNLMLELKNKKKENSILLITHNLAVVAETCDRVIVMYCGNIQEIANVTELFENPLHPYTLGLLKSIPGINTDTKRLYNIPGQVPDAFDLPSGCLFSNRCPRKMDICEKIHPELKEKSPDHFVRCHLYKD
jgi:peptide/nickel transport system ATP-binding protein